MRDPCRPPTGSPKSCRARHRSASGSSPHPIGRSRQRFQVSLRTTAPLLTTHADRSILSLDRDRPVERERVAAWHDKLSDLGFMLDVNRSTRGLGPHLYTVRRDEDVSVADQATTGQDRLRGEHVSAEDFILNSADGSRHAQPITMVARSNAAHSARRMLECPGTWKRPAPTVMRCIRWRTTASAAKPLCLTGIAHSLNLMWSPSQPGTSNTLIGPPLLQRWL